MQKRCFHVEKATLLFVKAKPLRAKAMLSSSISAEIGFKSKAFSDR